MLRTEERVVVLGAWVKRPPARTLTWPREISCVVPWMRVAWGLIVKEPFVEAEVESSRVGEKFPEASPRDSVLKEMEGDPEETRTVVLISIIASSAEVGTCAGDQLAAVNQFWSPAAPVHEIVAANAFDAAQYVSRRTRQRRP